MKICDWFKAVEREGGDCRRTCESERENGRCLGQTVNVQEHFSIHKDLQISCNESYETQIVWLF